MIKYLIRGEWFLHPFVLANEVRNGPASAAVLQPAKAAAMSQHGCCTMHMAAAASAERVGQGKSVVPSPFLQMQQLPCAVHSTLWLIPSNSPVPLTSTTPHNLSLVPRPPPFFLIFLFSIIHGSGRAAKKRGRPGTPNT